MSQHRPAAAEAQRVVAWLLAGLTLSCSDGLGPRPLDPCADDQTVQVSVNADAVPVFTWSPACGMASLQVFPSTGAPTGWVIYTGSRAPENPLRSGIRYGEAPPEAIEPAPAVTLESGREYVVEVLRWIGEPGGPGSIFSRGSATFQR